MARLILIRHGESIANAEGRYTRGPEEGLSPQGRRQAQSRAAQLAARFRPKALYTSPFERSLRTAEIVGAVLGLEPQLIEALREQHFGALHGEPYGSLRVGPNPDGLARWEFRPPEGETLREVAERAGPAFDAIARRHTGSDVVIVSHGGVMAALHGWAGSGFAAPPTLYPNAGGFLLLRDSAGGYAPPRELEA